MVLDPAEDPRRVSCIYTITSHQAPEQCSLIGIVNKPKLLPSYKRHSTKYHNKIGAQTATAIYVMYRPYCVHDDAVAGKNLDWILVRVSEPA